MSIRSPRSVPSKSTISIGPTSYTCTCRRPVHIQSIGCCIPRHRTLHKHNIPCAPSVRAQPHRRDLRAQAGVTVADEHLRSPRELDVDGVAQTTTWFSRFDLSSRSSSASSMRQPAPSAHGYNVGVLKHKLSLHMAHPWLYRTRQRMLAGRHPARASSRRQAAGRPRSSVGRLGRRR